VKKFTSCCQVLNKMHTKSWFLFSVSRCIANGQTAQHVHMARLCHNMASVTLYCIQIKSYRLFCMSDRKNNFRLIIYSQTSTNNENLAKIGSVEFEIIGLTKIVKIRNNSRTYSPPCLLLLLSAVMDGQTYGHRVIATTALAHNVARQKQTHVSKLRLNVS